MPEGGLNSIKKLSDHGVIVAGDAAGLCLNVGYSVRGMDLAVESGVRREIGRASCRERV